MARDVPEKFLVAFSFAGEQRDLVRAVAEAVEDALGESTVFFDEWYEFWIAGNDADLKLQEVYGDRAALVVVCVSQQYEEKAWTLVENEAIRTLLMQARTSQDKKERLRVLPLRVGEGNVKGIPLNAIGPDIRKRAPSITAELIVNRLRLIQPKSEGVIQKETKSATARPVFLADCTSDLEHDYDRMKAFLEDDLGWSVLTSKEYSDSEYKDRLQEDLKQSFAFVQLLGPFPWKRGAFDQMQNEAAETLGLQRFRYRSSDIDLAKVDKAHREFLNGTNIIASGFEDFKSYIERELNILKHKLDRPVNQIEDIGRPPLVRVVIRSPNPDPLWEEVFRWVYDQEKILADQVKSDENLLEKQLADPCDGFLVVCDSAAMEDGPHSTRKDMEQCRQIQLKEKNAARRPPVGLVYWPPPEASWAKLMRSIPDKLYRVVGDSPENLDEFFAEVRKVGL